MGLDVNGVKLILYARQLGANFQQVATIGRQGMHLSGAQLHQIFSQSGIKCTIGMHLTDSRYCESFFKALGAQSIESIDYSNYENATIIHDMNQPIPESLDKRFSVVLDAGTLEHVFNYPVAIKNCMKLLQQGGVFLSITPANNFMGHGFYQFSPELFFSVFSESNGFELMKLIICEHFDDAQWYEVSKPDRGIHGRVTLINNQPTYLMCIARRLNGLVEPFSTFPQQSDYIDTWATPIGEMNKQSMNAKSATLHLHINPILKSIPGIVSFVRWIRYLAKPSFTTRFYTPIDPL